jgi:ABC-2 type transport system permease protein
MKRWRMIAGVELRLFLRNLFNVMFALIFPLIMLLLYGGIYGNKPVALFGGHGMVDIAVPAYSCMTIAITGLLCLPLTVARYRERKILKRFMATPIHPLDILLSQVLVNFVMAAASMALLIFVGKILFGLHFPGQWLPTAISFMIITLSMFSIGLLIAGVIPDSKASVTVSFMVYFPMLYLSGAVIPAEMLPKNIAVFAKALPLTYGVELLKGIWLGGSLKAHFADILFLLVTFVLCTGVSVKLFRWESG